MVIQSDVYTIILLTIIIGIAIVVLSKKIDALDPLEKPKGIYAAVFAGVEMVSNTVTTNTGKDNAAKLTPYISTIIISRIVIKIGNGNLFLYSAIFTLQPKYCSN